MADLISMLAAVAGSGGGADPNFNQTVLLLHGDGTNGAQNNTFLDSSSNNFTITRNGNTTQGTFSPFSAEEGKWAAYFPINSTSSPSQRLQSSITTAFGTNNFTVDFWIYVIGTNSASTILDMRTGTGIALSIGLDTTSRLNVSSLGTGAAGTFIASSSTTGVPLHTWTHVAVVRSGTGTDEVAVYINGVLKTTGTCADSFTTTSVTLCNRYTSTSVNTTQCYLSNFRISDVARTISLPSSPYTSDANTKLLVCQSNRFIDNSSDNNAVTLPDATKPSITPFSPFAPTAAYSAGTNGGSGYFDGSGDYLSIADNAAFEFGSGDFCVELFAYVNALDSSGTVFLAQWATPNRGWIFGYAISGGTLNFDYSTTGSNSTSTAGAITFPIGQWAHFVACRSGNTLSTYLNGSRVATRDVTGITIFAPTQALEIGRNAEATTAWEMNGYIANLRIVKGSSPYDATQTTLTIPTSPLTAIANTSVLLNFTNAGIFDNTGKNVLETVADAQIDTTTKKFGTGSLEFDGTGDYLLLPNNVDQQLGTGNFTIEFWVYLASGDTGSARGLVAKGTSTTGWLVSLDSSQKVVFTYTTSTITSTGAITTNAWNYIAVVREGTGSNQTKIYIGGVNDGTGTVSTDFNQTSAMYIGANRTGGDPMKGFIDDLRITKGIARTITVPTAAFPDL